MPIGGSPELPHTLVLHQVMTYTPTPFKLVGYVTALGGMILVTSNISRIINGLTAPLVPMVCGHPNERARGNWTGAAHVLQIIHQPSCFFPLTPLSFHGCTVF